MNIAYTFKQIDLENQDEYNSLLKRLHSQYPFSDIFTASEPVDIKRHTHSDFEVRLFLSGSASFTIEDRTIVCVPGSLIEIAANIPHSFSYAGCETLKVLRFFSANDAWHANYC